MSSNSNPQWKSFQPPMDTSILDFKTMRGGYQQTGRGYGGSYDPMVKDMANNLFPQSPSNFSYNVFGSTNNSTSSNNLPSSIPGFPIGTFTGTEGTDCYNADAPSSNNYNLSNNSTSNNAYNDSSQNNQGTRETGIIEKLLHSYGFIQCCERQARLFFHFSQFGGNIEHLKIGDPVEFEMTYDRRTGKPIASIVSKIAPEVVLSEERVTGTVTTELRIDGSSGGGDTQGRISYENRGECFFLPYNKDDVEGNVTLRTGDKVSFQIATNPRGNLGATHVRLENPAHPVKYQGVVCSMKESFGFIERADVVKEIFFHFSEAKTNEPLELGDDVEFTIQTRNGKEVACNITTLPSGTVVFEDVCNETVKGQVLKPIERSAPRHQSTDPLPGRIRYRAPDHSEVEIPFGDKDQQGEFTLKHGDWVEFRIATDRRDQLQRATNISLLLESFKVSGERREQGAVAAIKDNYGFIRCADRDARLYFHFNEVLDDTPVTVDTEVEFTVCQDSMSNFTNQKMSAIRIKVVPQGTVVFETIVERNCEGLVTKEPSWADNSPSKLNNGQEKTDTGGLILYTSKDGTKKSIGFSPKACIGGNLPALGDKVAFNVAQVKRSKELKALDVRMDPGGSNGSLVLPTPNNCVQQQQPAANVQAVNNNHITSPSQKSNNGAVYQGYVAALKDGFGFIETKTHDSEVFFHFSNFEGDTNTLELGCEVEYTVGSRTSSGGSCASAENVHVLAKGTIAPHVTVGEEILSGFVLRPLRSVNPEQAAYSGLVSLSEEEDSPTYEFGITGLTNKRELLQVGDPVQFQVDSEGRAVNISAVRKKKKATVDSIKGHFGFLSYELDEGKKLFFHTTEIKDGANLQVGDSVEFVVITNQRNGKSFACNVSKLPSMGKRKKTKNIVVVEPPSDGSALPPATRPERLMIRRSVPSGDDNGPRLVVVRPPRGPSDTPFSKSARTPRTPGHLIAIPANAAVSASE